MYRVYGNELLEKNCQWVRSGLDLVRGEEEGVEREGKPYMTGKRFLRLRPTLCLWAFKKCHLNSNVQIRNYPNVLSWDWIRVPRWSSQSLYLACLQIIQASDFIFQTLTDNIVTTSSLQESSRFLRNNKPLTEHIQENKQHTSGAHKPSF
jgi:hypothetical protein